MNLTRLPDWQSRFAAFASSRRAMPFAWGSNDCSLFAADAVLAITGRDLAADLRGTYDSARGASRILHERGGMRAIATAALGPEVATGFAAVGDVLLMNTPEGEGLAICNGGHAIGAGPHGALVMPLAAAVAAWKVGPCLR